jgi:hypothetical protein
MAKSKKVGCPTGRVEKGIVSMLLMGLQVSGKRDWYQISHVERNFMGLKSDTVAQKVKSLEKKGIVDTRGGKVRLSPDVAVRTRCKV